METSDLPKHWIPNGAELERSNKVLKPYSNSPAIQLAKMILNKDTTGLYVLSGLSGSGKTSLCSDIASQACDAGMSVGGFLSPAIFEGDQKVGIDQIDVSTGEKRRLGWRVAKDRERTVGCWLLDDDVLAWVNQLVTKLSDEDLIIIDELGPLELVAGGGYQESVRLLDEERYRLALVVIRPTLLNVAQARWPHLQIATLEGGGK